MVFGGSDGAFANEQGWRGPGVMAGPPGDGP